MRTKRTGVRSWALWLLNLLVVSTVLAGCRPPLPGEGQPALSPAVPSIPLTATVSSISLTATVPSILLTDIVPVLDQHRDELMRLPGVVGVGIGQDETTGEPIILILIEELTPDLETALPQDLGGFPVKPLVVGEIKIQ